MVVWTVLTGDFGDARTMNMLGDVASLETLVTHGIKASGAAVANVPPCRYVSEQYADFQLDCYTFAA